MQDTSKVNTARSASDCAESSTRSVTAYTQSPPRTAHAKLPTFSAHAPPAPSAVPVQVPVVEATVTVPEMPEPVTTMPGRTSALAANSTTAVFEVTVPSTNSVVSAPPPVPVQRTL